MKILHVETGMNLYGGALQVLYLLRGLADRPEMENVLVCPEGSAISAQAAPAVSRLITVPMKGDLDLRFLGSLVDILRRERPDIVHLHSRRGADVLGGIAARLTGRTCVLTRRVDNPEPALLVRLKYRMYDRVITISEGIRDVLVSEGVPAGKIRCVPSAVEARIYSRPCDKYWFRTQFGLDEGERVCGVVAQFIERKGHRYLLRAVPEILAAVPAVRLLLFGKGPLEGELRSLCRELGIQDRVIFAGFREDLPRIMGCLDLVIHPALMEGLGVSLLQAAAAGIPIVATRVGGIPEIVTHQVNGFLVPPSDVAALTRATVRILGDHDLGQAMGDQGRRIVRDRFSIQTMVEGNLAVYSEIVRGRSIIQSLT